MNKRIAVPTDPGELSQFASYFMATHGMPPIAGGETPAATAPPAALTAPDPVTPAATPPADPSTPAPATTSAAPEGQQPPAEPGSGGAEPQGTPPEWAQTLLERMDEIAPPQVDPLAAELFGQPQAAPPQQPEPQQPGIPQQPQPGMPSQPGAPQGQMDEAAIVRNFIDERAQEIAQKAIEERVTPVLEQQRVQRRREEALALTDEYPELRDPQYQSSLMTKARSWAQQILGSPDAAGEPGFLELCLLASRQLDAAAQASPAQPGQNGSEVPIEQPGGANPGTAQPQTDQIADRIVSAGARRGLSPFWQ